MMKKVLGTVLGAAVAIALYALGFVNGAYSEAISDGINEAETLTVDELVMLYVSDEFGSDLSVEIYPADDKEYIDYIVYDQEGEAKYIGTVYRNWLKSMYGIH